MPSKLKKAIAAVKDQTSISIAKVSSNTSSTLEVAVLKATTHDDVPVDERYIHEVVQLVSSNKSYAAACARAIGKRIGRTRNWIVALKSLMLVLRIFQDGDPYFPREVLHAMKKGAKILNLSNFRDDSNSSPWDFTAFIRTFALYLDERLDCFLTGKLQRRYNYKEKENSRLFRTSSSSSSSSSIRRRTNEAIREMKPAMLLDKISYWQRLLERAIAIRPTGAAKTNCLVQVALYAVVQESFDLYKDVSDGLALVLDSFFHLQYQLCVNAFQTCVKAAKQFEEINSFYSFCKSVGVGRTSEYPSVQTITEELIESLQEFLKDQSSFPVKSSGQQLLQKPGSMKSLRSRDDSYGGQSEFSVASTEPYSERSTTTTSAIGSPCSSLEELIRATETGRKNPSISIDLEAYSDIQFRKQCSEDVCDTGSARSLPVSMIDLVSSSNWPGDDEDENNEVKRQNQQPVVEKERDSSSEKGQEVVLNEALKPSPSPLPSFGAFSGQQEPKQMSRNEANALSVEATSNNGWDLGLFEATPQTKSAQPMPSTTTANKVNGFNTSTFPSPSFGAFPEQQEPKQMSRNEANALSVEATSNNGWDLGLFEATPQTKSEQHRPNTTANIVDSFNTLPLPSFNAFPESQEQEKVSRIDAYVSSPEASSTNNGWDLALFEATPQLKASEPMPTISNNIKNFNASTLDELYSQSSVSLFPNSGLSSLQMTNTNGNSYDQSTTFLPASNNTYNRIPVMAQASNYNPFLQDTSTELPSNMFSTTAAPTFQATPTFSAQNSFSAVQSDVNSDPFGTFSSSEQTLHGAINQQNLLHEQQLWLQNQNKIIAKHMS